MSERARFVERTVEWVAARLAPPGVVVTAETPLFASGIVSSIRVLDLIAWTERAIGREIADVEIRLDNFRTVARIAEVFVREEGHAAA
ncbi:MAG TPA: phosphopantetheine-binding protein [Gemmatimonadaceae bacterium]